MPRLSLAVSPHLCLPLLLAMASASAHAAVTLRLADPELNNIYVGADDSASMSRFALNSTTEIVGANGRSSSSIAGGFMKARAEAWEFSPNGQFFMSWGLDLENTSFFEQLVLPAGALAFAVDGRFLRQQGLFGDGSINTELRATILANGTGPYSERLQGNLWYRGWRSTAGAEETIFDTATGNANANVSARLGDEDFAVHFSNAQPLVIDGGDRLEIQVELSLDVSLALTGAPVGFYALLDAGNSASLSLTLPPDVRISNPPAGLTWVSVVPEPASAALWILGLASLLATPRVQPQLGRHSVVRGRR